MQCSKAWPLGWVVLPLYGCQKKPVALGPREPPYRDIKRRPAALWQRKGLLHCSQEEGREGGRESGRILFAWVPPPPFWTSPPLLFEWVQSSSSWYVAVLHRYPGLQRFHLHLRLAHLKFGLTPLPTSPCTKIRRGGKNEFFFDGQISLGHFWYTFGSHPPPTPPSSTGLESRKEQRKEGGGTALVGGKVVITPHPSTNDQKLTEPTPSFVCLRVTLCMVHAERHAVLF